MPTPISPRYIHAYLAARVLGQEEMLRQVSVSVYKHLHGIQWGNILLIGNSGTGKTTIMKTIRSFYAETPGLEKFRCMAIMNANTLVDDQGEVRLNRVLEAVEAEVRSRVRRIPDAATLKALMENATVCFDEIDKVSARIAGRVNVTGIAVQQALLTILEGETLHHETVLSREGQERRVRIPVDTARMLFICGGAFEELYDQVFTLVKNGEDERVLKTVSRWNDIEGRLDRQIHFTLRQYLKMSDLFTYGMVPQFIARFSAICILEDLRKKELRQILLTAQDSPLRNARQYFQTFGIDLVLTDEAQNLLAAIAEANPRIGARALRESFSRLIADYQFHPTRNDLLADGPDGKRLVIDEEAVRERLVAPEKDRR